MSPFTRKHIFRIRSWDVSWQRVFSFRAVSVVGYLKKREMDFYSVEGKDLEGIVSQLRLTAGVEVAIFIYEMQTQLF